MHRVQGIVLCLGSVTDYYGEWLYKKKSNRSGKQHHPFAVAAENSTSCVHSQDNDSCSGETGSVPGEHQHNTTTMEPLVHCYVYAHMEKHSEWRLLHNRGADCRGGVVKPVYHHGKRVNRLKSNTTSHGALQTITEGHTMRAWVTCTLYLNTRSARNTLSSSHMDNHRINPCTPLCF